MLKRPCPRKQFTSANAKDMGKKKDMSMSFHAGDANERTRIAPAVYATPRMK
jgi:hypothetical protein